MRKLATLTAAALLSATASLASAGEQFNTTIILLGAAGGTATGHLLANGAVDTLRGDMNLRLAEGPLPPAVPNVLSVPGEFREIDRLIISTIRTVVTGSGPGFGNCGISKFIQPAYENRFDEDELKFDGTNHILGYVVQAAFQPNLGESGFPTANTIGCLALFSENAEGISTAVFDPTDANRFILNTLVGIPPSFQNAMVLSIIGDVEFED